MPVAVDVLDLDRRVVDKDSDRKRQSAEGHDVDRVTKQVEDGDGCQDRKRDRDADDDGAAPASKKEQDHQAGEYCGNDSLADNSVDRSTHEDALIEHAAYVELFRNHALKPVEFFLNLFDDIECRGIAVLEDGEQCATGSILADNIDLDRIAIPNLGDILQVDH